MFVVFGGPDIDVHPAGEGTIQVEVCCRALRTAISDDAWATANFNVSRPFPHPTAGKAR